MLPSAQLQPTSPNVLPPSCLPRQWVVVRARMRPPACMLWFRPLQVRLARTRRRAAQGLFERSAREGASGLDYAGVTSSRAVFGQ
jgi:hypothetical protein